MKQCIKEAIDRFIYKLEEISKTFKIKIEGGNNVSFIIVDKDFIKYKIICNNNTFNLDYEKKLPFTQNGVYSKWTSGMLNIMSVISDINNIFTRNVIDNEEILQYFSLKSSKYTEFLNETCCIYAN